jgi:hypothetical protein
MFEALEIELYDLIASIIDCLNTVRFTEAQVLRSDLQWALSATAGVFPRLGLMQRLGMTVETLLDRIVLSSND